MPATKSIRSATHYAMFDKKTLCGLPALKGEEFLTDKTSCQTCLKQATLLHFQLAKLASRLLNDMLQ